MPSKKTKPGHTRSFRLFDFHIYNEVQDKEEEHSSGSDSDHKKSEQKKDNKSFVIQMFGINEKGETHCVYVNDYLPFFYVKVGDDWNKSSLNAFVEYLKKHSDLQKYYSESLVEASLVNHHKLYGFSGGKEHRFAKLVFSNSIAMNKYKNLWYFVNDDPEKYGDAYRVRKNIVFKDIETELYESNIPPLLRYFHIQEISPSGWVCFNTSKAIKVEQKTTTCRFEYICSMKHLKTQPEKETSVPYKICSYDIEASSSHGDFPIPIKTYKRLVANIIDVFSVQRDCIIMDPDNEASSLEVCRNFMKQAILTAFGYSKMDDIDPVYPKIKPSKNKITRNLETLTTLEVKGIEDKMDETSANLIKISDAFDQMKEQLPSTGNPDAELDTDNNVTDAVNYTKHTKKAPRMKKSTTIAHLLLSEKYTRDEKITEIDKTLTIILPQLKGDEVTFIGSTFMRYGETDPYRSHCLVVGDCDNIDGIEVETAKTEKDLLLQWKELIQQEDPDIIIGYNIFGFDYEFMFRRSQETNCANDFLMLSRKINESCGKRPYNGDGEITIGHTKMQIASGEYDLRYVEATGRLQIDLYAYFRRDFNLSSYKLDDVAGQYIGDGVKHIELDEHPEHGKVTKLYSKNLQGLRKNDFIHIELTSFTTDYYMNGKKFVVKDIEYNVETDKGKLNIIVIEGHYDVDMSKKIKWGMAKDDVTPQDIFRLSNGTASDRAIVAKYCIQDCNLVHFLMNKIDVITGYVEMASICSVPISFLVFRGQGIKLTSYVAKKCREKSTLMPDVEKPRYAEGYEGAIVLPPKCSMYMDNPVACVDYSSLYPSSMISQNYSHDSKVWTKEYDLEGKIIKITGERDKYGNFIYDNLPEYQYIDIEFDTYRYMRKHEKSREEKTKVGKMICRWAQFPDNKKGVMPSILTELLKARKETRKKIKTEPDPFMQNILDKRQLGYKVTANSLYGQCGSRTSTFYDKDVAASTTATGRMMIIYARRIIEEVYGNSTYKTEKYGVVRTRAEYVYGDTDSVFFTFNLENAESGEKIKGYPALETTIEIAQEAADICTKYLKPPMGLEYEKTLMPFILLSKKRYVGMLYEEDPNKGYMKFMGLSIKRRDSCDYLKDVYGGILNILMQQNDIQAAMKFLQQSLTDLVEGKVSMDKLAITKALRSGYKNPHQIGHKVLADRIGKRDPGNKPKPGDRMKFVFVVNDTPKALMGDKIETPEFIIDNNLKIDYTHYVTNQLMKPLQQLFGLALEQIWTLQNKRLTIKAYKRDIIKLEKEYLPDIETFMKKREKYCSAKIKKILFDDILIQIQNDKYDRVAITRFF